MEEKEPEDPSIVKFDYKDSDDGSYIIAFTQPDPCECVIDISYKD